MKLIILDYFRRWWLVLVALFIAYVVFQVISIHDTNSQISGEGVEATVNHTIGFVHNIFVFQVVMWLGFLSMFDLQRGGVRTLTILPLTAKQIGRALWLASVLLPGLALLVIGFITFFIFSSATNGIISLESHLTNWILSALYLGAIFGARTLMTTKIPDTFVDRIRTILPNLLFVFALFGLFFLQMQNVTMAKATMIFTAYLILSVAGWFRAERIVLQRTGIRFAAQSSNKKTAHHKTPQGFGGLPYLVQRIFVQSTFIGLALIGLMTLFMSFLSHGQNPAQALVSMIHGGSIPYVFFILIFSIVPIVFQLRFLRTLPVSSLALAATLVFLPVASIAAVGLIVTVVASLLLGEPVILPTANNFLLLGAKAAIIVSLIVWRGLDVLTYLLIFLMLISDSFISLGMTIVFHLGSNTPGRPLWVNLTVFLLCVVVSFALTRRLLVKSSSAYRVRTMPANAWSMARR
ncbi:MAG TPA: hypothetical protein VGM58_08615 [Verrucomicrobiae bacterium]|jgi:hypothetical protein